MEDFGCLDGEFVIIPPEIYFWNPWDQGSIQEVFLGFLDNIRMIRKVKNDYKKVTSCHLILLQYKACMSTFHIAGQSVLQYYAVLYTAMLSLHYNYVWYTTVQYSTKHSSMIE